MSLRGLPVTRPSRIASDLLWDHEDPEAVAQLLADSIRAVFDYPGTFADQLAPHAIKFAMRKGDGFGLLRWFLELTNDPDVARWMVEARAHVDRVIGATTWATFHVDLSGTDLRMTGRPEDVPPVARGIIPEVEQRGYRAYPLVDHVADKVAATYERHGEMGNPSTRYRDLVDLVAIMRGASVEAEDQLIALRSEFERPSGTAVEGCAN